MHVEALSDVFFFIVGPTFSLPACALTCVQPCRASAFLFLVQSNPYAVELVRLLITVSFQNFMLFSIFFFAKFRSVSFLILITWFRFVPSVSCFCSISFLALCDLSIFCGGFEFTLHHAGCVGCV